MEKKKIDIKRNFQQLKINFEVVEKTFIKSNSEAKIISISNTSKNCYENINPILKNKIYKDIISNSKSH